MGWQVLGHSETGAAHLRQGKPNQDALGYCQSGTCTLLALADGHGSAKYRHSDTGAKLAVATALRVLERFATDLADGDPKTIKDSLGRLPRELVRSWREAVDAIDAEAVADGHSAYGSTLLAVLLTARYALYLQLGDGDLLVLDGDGNLRRPLPKAAGMIANETHSLCQAQAESLCQTAIHFFDHAPPPKLVFLATDGYANSFVNAAEFEQAVHDFDAEVGHHGVAKVQACLPAWLWETSEQGSGDDVTIGILVPALAGPGEGQTAGVGQEGLGGGNPAQGADACQEMPSPTGSPTGPGGNLP